MPIYEYRCLTCDWLFENLQRWNDDPPDCPRCGSQVKRLQSKPSIRFKGTGFHATDYTRTGPKMR